MQTSSDQKAGRSFTELKKLSKQDASNMPSFRLAIVGDCSTQHLSTAVKGCFYCAGVRADLFDADYNQLDAQFMDPQSELYAFRPNAVLIFMSTEKLYEAFCETAMDRRTAFAEHTYERIQSYWAVMSGSTPVPVLQYNFVQLDDGCFGSFALKTESSFPFQLQKLNWLLMQGAGGQKNVYLVDVNGVQSLQGRESTFDDAFYYLAKLPFSLNSLPAVAKRTVDVALALMGRVKKCVILDLDNTLWGGTIGDDGLNGIQIGELGGGYAFTDFQKWLRELKNRGVLLAVCSKNEEKAAKEPFLSHPDMVLRLDDFAAFLANWEDKATNIRRIQQMLNIGMDSLVFIDDNSFERELVRTMIPEITVPELPEDSALYLKYLRELNLFETAAFTRNDADRTQQYRQEAMRNQMQSSFASYDDYLSELDMRAVAAPFDAFHYPRIAQLTQRSNQFNLRTIRYTEAQIAELAEDDSCLTRYYTLKDKFGDYGLISVVIMEKQPGETLFISEWLMSCRVLKRGMEEFIVNDILQAAKENGYRRVVGEYMKTPKNAMVEHIYEKMGFTPLGGGRYSIAADGTMQMKTYVRRNDGATAENTGSTE